MSANELSMLMQPAIEIELQRQVARLDESHTRSFYEILTYHMGWTGDGAGPEAQGKRIRPLLLLLTNIACGTDWQTALPAAAAVELIHNFSLIHDDIQDSSELRRGRTTVWKKWGMPLGINTGDAFFVLAAQAVLDLLLNFPASKIVTVQEMLFKTCLDLTRGQFLDMSYEKRPGLTLKDYWLMVNGKTAALLAASCGIGALLGGADETTQDAYDSFGHYLGLAFQVQDDLLGIWGDSALTGKPTESDLAAGKNSLPVLFGLENNREFAQRWKAGPIHPEEIPDLADLLTQEGARLFTQETADKLTDQALHSLRLAAPIGEAGEALFKIPISLLNRTS